MGAAAGRWGPVRRRALFLALSRSAAAAFSAASETRLRRSENCEVWVCGLFATRRVGGRRSPDAWLVWFGRGLLFYFPSGVCGLVLGPRSCADFDQRRPRVDLGRVGGRNDGSASASTNPRPPSLAATKGAQLLHPSTKRQREGRQSLLAAEKFVASEYRLCGDERQEQAKLTSESVARRKAFLVHLTLRRAAPGPHKVTASPLRGLRRALTVRDVVPRWLSGDHR